MTPKPKTPTWTNAQILQDARQIVEAGKRRHMIGYQHKIMNAGGVCIGVGIRPEPPAPEPEAAPDVIAEARRTKKSARETRRRLARRNPQSAVLIPDGL